MMSLKDAVEAAAPAACASGAAAIATRHTAMESLVTAMFAAVPV